MLVMAAVVWGLGLCSDLKDCEVVSGLEVWKKPLSEGRGMAVILFHRNSSAVRHVSSESTAAPPPPVLGQHVSMVATAGGLDLELTGKSMKLKDHAGMCLGALPALCKCSNRTRATHHTPGNLVHFDPMFNVTSATFTE
jgi:hypothetical protein